MFSFALHQTPSKLRCAHGRRWGEEWALRGQTSDGRKEKSQRCSDEEEPFRVERAEKRAMDSERRTVLEELVNLLEDLEGELGEELEGFKVLDELLGLYLRRKRGREEGGQARMSNKRQGYEKRAEKRERDEPWSRRG